MGRYGRHVHELYEKSGNIHTWGKKLIMWHRKFEEAAATWVRSMGYKRRPLLQFSECDITPGPPQELVILELLTNADQVICKHPHPVGMFQYVGI